MILKNKEYFFYLKKKRFQKFLVVKGWKKSDADSPEIPYAGDKNF